MFNYCIDKQGVAQSYVISLKYWLIVYRRISAIMEVPYYTTTVNPGARLVLNDKGVPVYQGMTSATFTVRLSDSSITKVLFYWSCRCLFHTAWPMEHLNLILQLSQIVP